MPEEHLERVRQQFTRTAEVYARMRQTTDARSLEALVGLSGAKPSDRVLDVACGPGFLTLAFATRCAEATGFDATDAFLELARIEAKDRGLGNVRFEHGDAEHLPFDAASFDVVSCRAAFHHFPEPARVLAEMVRVVVPGGRVLVADLLGNEDPARAALHDRIERLCDPTHVRSIPASEFADLFAGVGVARVHEVKSTLDYDLEEWIAHGAPADEARAEIVSLMESSLPSDGAGLAVRREDGRLRFTHRTAAFVLERTVAG